jgi:hypothetical protein
MELVAAAIVLLAAGVTARRVRKARASRRAERLREADAFRLTRRAAEEDVTRMGEELTELHVETLTTSVDAEMRADYQAALDAYDRAKGLLVAAETASDVTSVTRTLADGRFSHACVLARRDGRERPARRPPCFFDPAHGPAERDVEWAPPGGVPREVPVCFRDFERLTAGELPEARLVRLGSRRVPWFASGPSYSAWAQGWYGDLVDQGRFRADRLTMAFWAGPAGPDAVFIAGAAAWSDPGAWEGGGIIGGYDYGSHGSDVGGFGGDFGGGGDVGGGGGGGD